MTNLYRLISEHERVSLRRLREVELIGGSLTGAQFLLKQLDGARVLTDARLKVLEVIPQVHRQRLDEVDDFLRCLSQLHLIILEDV